MKLKVSFAYINFYENDLQRQDYTMEFIIHFLYLAVVVVFDQLVSSFRVVSPGLQIYKLIFLCMKVRWRNASFRFSLEPDFIPSLSH